MKAKKISAFTLIIIMFTCAACWDRHEVEELGLVVAMAVDKESGSDDKFTMTTQFVNPNGVREPETGFKDSKAYFNLSRSGESIFETLQDFDIVSSRIPNFEHLNIIVISQEAAKSIDVYRFVHTLLAFWEVPRNAYVLISESEARSLLSREPELEHMPAFEIDRMVTTETGTSKKQFKRSLGDLAKDFAAGSSVAVQKVSFEESIALKGAAIICGKEYKLLGFLDERETEGLNWLNGNAVLSSISIEEKESGNVINTTLNIKKHKIEPKIKDDRISFKVSIIAEGDITENWSETSDVMESEFLRGIEVQISDEMEKRIYDTLDALQKKFKADVAYFWKTVRSTDFRLWEEIKDDWDDIFSEADIEVNVDFHTRGFHNRTSR
ncbi:MAG: Ger(x)C family spore germination protein [Clostridiales bacterium]|nr:Ger(x)C family spore germination protein [Clostridiales bacterium]